MKSASPMRVADTPGTQPDPESARSKVLAQTPRVRSPSPASDIPHRSSDRRAAPSRTPYPWLIPLTQPRSCILLVGISVLALIYACVTGARMVKRPNPPASSGWSRALDGSPAVDLASLETLRHDAQAAHQRLITSRTELRPLLETLETLAREKGWALDVRVGSVITAPNDWPDLVGYPVSISLAPAAPQPTASYASLVEWIEALSRLPKQVHIENLRIKRTTAKTSASIDLLFLGSPTNDKAPQK